MPLLTAATSQAEEVKEQKYNSIKALTPKEMIKLRQDNSKKHALIRIKTDKRAEAAQKIFKGSRPLLSETQINSLTDAMADSIYLTLKDSAPLILTLYPQGAHFSNHLTTSLGELNLTLEENYLDLQVVDDEVILLRVEPLVKLEGRVVLIADVALQDGRTMNAALRYCKERGARAVYCATLIDMPESRVDYLKNLRPSFYGAIYPNLPLVGLGFEIDGFFGNAPELRALSGSISKISDTNTTTILTALKMRAHQPLVLQESIPASQEALLKARQAEKTLAKLELLHDEQAVENKIKYTAEQVKAQLKDSHPVVLSMQKGGSHFTTRLTECLTDLPLEEGYMHITRYGNSQEGGNAKIIAEPSVDLKGRTVLISEDLIEGGLTIQLAISLCIEKGAVAVYVAAMGDKPQKRMKGLEFIKPDFHCYKFDDRFLVGTGLDEQENLRNKIGVWAHPKRQAAVESKLGNYGKYFITGAALLGVGLFAAYKLTRKAAPALKPAASQLKL